MNSSASSSSIILPGATLGVLGSGQLGRMFAIAAKRLGYRVAVFSPDADSPAGQVSDFEFVANYDDHEQLRRFAEMVDVVTLEFENIPVATVEFLNQHKAVRHGAGVLTVTQNRLREKSFLRDSGFPVGHFWAVRSLEELTIAVHELATHRSLRDSSAAKSSLPIGVLKTTTDGYDGKGQTMLRSADEAQTAWQSLNTSEAILESFVQYEYEFSVIAARTAAGAFCSYAPFKNSHRNHILDVSVSPAGVPESASKIARSIIAEVMEILGAVGVLCIEFFYCGNDELLINEIAPRPHNSGHLTIDAHQTCQFEQQVRAICGLPLGSTAQIRPAAMANLLGDCWSNGEPDWAAVLAMPDVKLHLYGKQTPLPGRKMGHLTAMAGSPDAAVELVMKARGLLKF